MRTRGEKRKAEGEVSKADQALKSPRPVVGGKSLASLGLTDAQAAAAPLSDSSDSSGETSSSSGDSAGAGDGARCHHMRLDPDLMDMAVFDLMYAEEPPTCQYRGCGITWKGAGQDKAGMMRCITLGCHYVSCAGWLVREDPRGHALGHAVSSQHYVAQWYDEPNMGYCFKCTVVMRLSDNPSLMGEAVKDERGTVVSKSKDDCGIGDSSAKLDWPMVASSSMPDLETLSRNVLDQWGIGAGKDAPTSMADLETLTRNVLDQWGIGAGKDASSSMPDLETLARNALDQWGMGAGNDVSGYAMGDGYIVRGMPNPSKFTCYMNASLQCLFALGKLRALILRPGAPLGHIGLHLKQLFVETSNMSNATRMLDPNMIMVYLRSLHKDVFEEGIMEDSHEFLTCLFDALDNEVDQLNKEFPTFSKAVFIGQLIQTISCQRCSHTSVMQFPLNGLSLSIPSKDPPARSKPLQVDSTEGKDVVQICMQTQKNDVPPENIEVPIALDFIPNLFDHSEEMEESAADSHNTEDKEKARGSAIVHDEAKHISTLGSIEDCLTLFFHDTLVPCPGCPKVAELPGSSGSKTVEPIMASTNVNTTVNVDQTELSDMKTCSNEQSSDFNSLLAESQSDEKDLTSCSRADEKAESREGVEKPAPSCIPTGKQSDLLSAQDIQDTSTQKQDSGKHVLDDHSAQRVEETQNDQTDSNGSANQTQLISKLPPVLIIQLKKFLPDLSKLRGHVSFEEILQLGPFMDHSSEYKDNSSYRLVGVIEHFGDTPKSGHYIAYVRGSGSSWICANDLNITVVSLERVLRCEAYLLFYERMER